LSIGTGFKLKSLGMKQENLICCMVLL